MDTGSDEAADNTADAALSGLGPTDGCPRRVLFVDDEPGAADLAAIHVERLVDSVETVTRTTPEEALAVIRNERVDCVVSDYDMPGSNGLEFLGDVRQVESRVPFVLFTGKGSEEIASEAISAGVTDYLQKGTGRDRYEMLANSVENALDRRRAERDLCDVNGKITAIHEFATDLASVGDITAVFERAVTAAEEILEFDRCVATHRREDMLVPAAFSESVTEDEIRTFAVGEGIAGTTAADERTIVVDNLGAGPVELDDAEDSTELDQPRIDAAELADPVVDDIRSVISVPIGSHGVFQSVSDGRAAFGDRDVEFAELLTAHAADAIEQIETENALRRERDRLTALFDDLPLPAARTVVFDDGGRRLDATNEAFEEAFGYTAAEHGYAEIRDGIVPADGARLDGAAVLGSGESRRLEVRRHTTDGLRDFILHAIPVKRPDETVIYGLYADIDEQKRVERILRKLHQTTREMFRGENREEVAAIAARAAIDILGFPNSGVRLYDADTNALLPTAISDEATEAIGDRPAFGPDNGRLWEAFETGDPIVVDDLDAVETAIGYGDLRSLLVVPLGDQGVMPLGSCDPTFFDDTVVQLARVLGANVTVALEHAERTEQLRERDAALQREIDRLAKFAGLVSHDLRNPLNVATGRLELAMELVDDETALGELDQVTDAHDRMEQLIDDLLTLARQGQTVDESETVELADAAIAAWRTVDTATATLETPTDSITVDADPERLRTLLENLFINSVEHSSTSSRTEPDDSVGHGRSRDDAVSRGDENTTEFSNHSTDNRTASDDVSVTVGPLSDGFYVADDGPGFDIDPKSAIEYGTSSDPHGTGFGLAIVREIAAAHGWALSIHDSDGARFEFRTDD